MVYFKDNPKFPLEKSALSCERTDRGFLRAPGMALKSPSA